MRKLMRVTRLPVPTKETMEAGYLSPAKTMESIVGAIHCILGGSEQFLWKGKPYTFHKGKFQSIEDLNKMENRIRATFEDTNIEIVEVSDEVVLVRQDGYSKKYRAKDIGGTLVLERINVRKKKKKCTKTNCPFLAKGACHYDPMSDEEPLCDDSERLLSLGVIEAL